MSRLARSRRSRHLPRSCFLYHDFCSIIFFLLPILLITELSWSTTAIIQALILHRTLSSTVKNRQDGSRQQTVHHRCYWCLHGHRCVSSITRSSLNINANVLNIRLARKPGTHGVHLSTPAVHEQICFCPPNDTSKCSCIDPAKHNVADMMCQLSTSCGNFDCDDWYSQHQKSSQQQMQHPQQ